MKLIHTGELIYLEAKETKVTDEICVELHSPLKLEDYKTYYSVNKSPYTKFDRVFKLDKEYYNKQLTIGLKLVHKQTRETNIYTTDCTTIAIFKSLKKPLNIEMPEAFKAGLNRVKEAEAKCEEVAKELQEELEALRKQFDKLAKAVVELGRKGEIL